VDCWNATSGQHTAELLLHFLQRFVSTRSLVAAWMVQKVELVHVLWLDLIDFAGTHTSNQEPSQEPLCKSKHTLALVAAQQRLLLAFVAEKALLKLATMPDVPHAVAVDGTAQEQRVLSFQGLHKGSSIASSQLFSRPAHDLSCQLIIKHDLPARHAN